MFAETTTGDGPLQTIVGTLSANTDVDFYLIHVDDLTTFRCTTVGGASWDTTLWMFKRSGRGIAFNDDSAGTVQSTLTGQFLTRPNWVLIAISAWDNDPRDSANGELWLDTPFNTERQPDGPARNFEVTQWDGAANAAAGSYQIFLSGASYARKVSSPPAEIGWGLLWPGFFANQARESQYTPSGQPITSTVTPAGTIVVSLPFASDSGVVHVGTSNYNTHAVVRYWETSLLGDLTASVQTYDNGVYNTQVPFSVYYHRYTSNDVRAAYLIADQPTAATYQASTNMWNGNRGPATITRDNIGQYRVEIPGFTGSPSGERGHVQVSAYSGRAPRGVRFHRPRVVGWGFTANSVVISVGMIDDLGAPADGMFVLSYHEDAALMAGDQGSAAYLRSTQASASHSADPLWADSTGAGSPANAERIDRQGTGLYAAVFPDMVWDQESLSQVTATTRHTAISVSGPGSGGTYVLVRTHLSDGTPEDGMFSVLLLSDRPGRNAATNAVVGRGCHGPVLNALTRPLLGTNWTFDLTGLPANSLFGFIQLGLTNPNLPLGFAGAPECVRLQDVLATHLLLLPIGHPSFTLPLSTNPVWLGLNIFVQGGALATGVNPLGLAASNGIHGIMGNN
ncbi:MAG: hypothetical protein IPK26_15470 [Planctomycetes bacterium]|nr:hypothetical protein [Planctomycetota bacterium]